MDHIWSNRSNSLLSIVVQKKQEMSASTLMVKSVQKLVLPPEQENGTLTIVQVMVFSATKLNSNTTKKKIRQSAVSKSLESDSKMLR